MDESSMSVSRDSGGFGATTFLERPISMSDSLARSPSDSAPLVSEVWPYRRIVLHAFALFIVLISGLVGYAAISDQPSQVLTRENGLLETTQVILLAATIVLGIATLCRSSSVFARERGFWRYVSCAIVCVAMLGFTREIQSINAQGTFDGFALPRPVKRAVAAFAVLAFMMVSAVSAYRMRGQLRSLTRFASLRFLWPMIPFASCLVAAQVSEELGWVFAEEAVEVMAYSMLVVTCGWLLTTKQLGQTDASIMEEPVILSMGSEKVSKPAKSKSA